MPTLTFHGAARTVTGSKHLLEVDGRRILIDCGQFQGRKDLRLLNWTKFPFDPKDAGRGHPDPRPPRPLGPAAAAGRGRLQGPHLLHAGHARLVRAGPARRRPHPGRGRPPGQQVRLHQARAGAAAVHRERRGARPDPAAADRLREGVRSGQGPELRLRARRAPARLGLRPRARRQWHRPLRRRPGALRPSGPARSGTGRPGRRAAARIDLRRSAAPGRRRRRAAGRGHPDHHRSARQGRSSRRSRSAASRRSSTGSSGSRKRAASRSCRSTSTARWRTRR